MKNTFFFGDKNTCCFINYETINNDTIIFKITTTTIRRVLLFYLKNSKKFIFWNKKTAITRSEKCKLSAIGHDV
jgi:hypothetical protein